MLHIRNMRPAEIDEVLTLWNANVRAAVGHDLPSADLHNVSTVLTQYQGQDEARCFVAIRGVRVVGFVTCALLRHPVLLGLSGEVEELGARPEEPLETRLALVRHAAHALQAAGASVIHARVGTEPPNDAGLYQRLGWENDLTLFSIYRSVPGALALQRVWDDLQSPSTTA